VGHGAAGAAARLGAAAGGSVVGGLDGGWTTDVGAAADGVENEGVEPVRVEPVSVETAGVGPEQAATAARPASSTPHRRPTSIDLRTRTSSPSTTRTLEKASDL
jgi:hypothetical protein